MDKDQLEALLDSDALIDIVQRTLPDARVTREDIEARIAKFEDDPDPRLSKRDELRELLEGRRKARSQGLNTVAQGASKARAKLDQGSEQLRKFGAKLDAKLGDLAADRAAGEDPLVARQREAKGRHTLYALTARHHRVEPYEADWVGNDCQSVRVTVPQSADPDASFITYLGVVKASDHLVFSVDEVVQCYAEAFGSTPTVGRVDLITGARHLDLDRFSPISIFLAFTNADDEVPSFYILEAGSAQGNPEALYPAPDMASGVHTQADFSFTPFACAANWYTGALTMDDGGTEPRAIVNSVAQEKDGKRHYLTLSVDYEVIDPGVVKWPVFAQAEAVLRVCALSQGMGVASEIESLLGDCAREVYRWEVEPPRTGEADGYDGCPPSDESSD